MLDYSTILESATSGDADGSKGCVYRPLPCVKFSKRLPPNVVVKLDKEDKKKLYKAGLKLISSRKVAIAILAGGQGTRLSGVVVKALAQVTPIKRKSLLQLMFEKIYKIFNMCNVLKEHPLVYLLTSAHTRKAIVGMLTMHGYFGLDRNRVVILTQYSLPCFTISNRKVLTYPDCITGVAAQAHGDEWVAVAPNGNGALFSSLASNGIFTCQAQQLQWLHVVSIDNCLSRPLDPEFLGLTLHTPSADALCKCIERDPGEMLGVFCKTKENKVSIVEYSELYRFQAKSKKELETTTVYGNICDHLFSGKMLRNFISSKQYKMLPYHAAKKQVPYWDAKEQRLAYPREANCFKLELFIFDALSHCNGVVCMLVDRRDSFLPVKNAADLRGDKEDNAKDHNAAQANSTDEGCIDGGGEEDDDVDEDDTSVQAQLVQVYKRWLGCTLPGKCEVSPLVSYGGEGLQDLKGKIKSLPRYIC